MLILIFSLFDALLERLLRAPFRRALAARVLESTQQLAS